MSYLRLTGITKTFNTTKVLDSFSLDVRKGEMVTLLGPSGCGKSTLLRCISGLTPFEEGSVELDGEDIGALPVKNRGVGMVFQSYALFPNMTVAQNIAFGLQLKKVSKEETQSRVDEMLRLIHMQEKRNAYPHELSGGQQQRVALGRSLVVKPKLLLLDEPLSALDAKIRRTLRSELLDIQKELKMTMLFVTHDQEEALTISDRICVMNQGVIEQLGTPQEIYNNPKSEFVARFIGHYNVLEKGRLERMIGEPVEQGEMFAIRPEAVKLYPVDTPGLLQKSLGYMSQAVVASSTMLGGTIRYRLAVGGEIELDVDRLNDQQADWIYAGAVVGLFLPYQEVKILNEDGEPACHSYPKNESNTL